jgi:ligand-binding sensor domain-containing protein/two-component sensor histidine kinase
MDDGGTRSLGNRPPPISCGRPAVNPRWGWRWAACLALLVLSSRPAFPLDPTKRLTQYAHRIWQLPQGLPDATITSILQTEEGYLWLGTETGLVRFDGVRFSSLDDTSRGPLKHNWVRTLLEDRPSGQPDARRHGLEQHGLEQHGLEQHGLEQHGLEQHGLWIGTNDAGLIRLDNGVATTYAPEQGLAGANVQCLVADRNGALWACTSNGVARLAAGKLTVYRTSPGLAMTPGLAISNVRAGCSAPDGTLWFGGEGAELSSWNGTEFVGHKLASMPSYGAVRALSCSEDGALWIGTTNGLIRYQAGQERLFTVQDGLADNWIYCLLQTRENALWIGTKNGFSRLRNNRIESFRPEDGLSQSTVYSIYEDREGSLWVGTKHGLNQFLEGRATPYTVSEGLPTNNTGPILQDRSGTIWIGTLGAGLCRLDDGHCRSLTTKDGLAGNFIRSLTEDNAGDVWVGTDTGLSRLKDGRVDRTYTTADGLPANLVRFLSRDHGGGLWIGTSAGLTLFRDGKFIQPRGVQEASRPSILGGGEDAEGHFLATTEAGVSLYQNGEFHVFTPPGDSPLREVDTVYTDPDGLVWMGTFGSGLRLLKAGKAFSFFMRDGLFDNEIYGIVPDGQNRLWMASSKGIFSVNRSDLQKFANGEIQKVVSTPYSALDGLRTIECKPGVQPAVWKMKDGRLWFSTIRGLLVIDPARLQRNSPVPPVVIEGVSVNGQDQSPGLVSGGPIGSGQIGSGQVSMDQIGKLPPGRKDLEFRYTALSFLQPTNLTFRYILDGYDTAWTDAGNRRVAYYTNLPPGQFRFRVTACNSDGACNQSGGLVAFSLARHYYQRVWFFPLCAVLLAAGIWLGWRQRVRGLRKQFDVVLAERSRIARELHDTLIQGFSGITMGMQAVSLGLPPCEEQRQLKELIHDAANSLKESRESVARLRGPREADSELSDAIAQVAGQITKSRDVRLKLKVEPSPADLGAEVEYNLLRIVQEAVTNAANHSGASTIEVGFHCTPERIGLSIEDDGHGFLHEQDFTQLGHYGLAGMRERAEEIGAEFSLATGPGKGTAIRLQLQRKNENNRLPTKISGENAHREPVLDAASPPGDSALSEVR